ncbi:alkyl hydroperoxide reductase [Sphingomonas oleivorans]|uniref:thioredoxin-dependent peroxiredoxin n=1 Tax=Sphingomonas oleivorans TaxID=1735121 RepID=A0A2T5FTX6_9SPHN|nr:alkyl hydroperoxide reductase [Sphingomonas oleivorans]
MPESLNAQFAALHAERERSWDPEKLARNVDQRRELVAKFDPAQVIKIGDQVEPFELLDVEGGTVTLDALVADGPAVLIFFRFAGCPACNLALPYYDRQLWPQLAAAGIPLVAISPQLPERLGEIRTRHALGFRVASDPDNRLGRRFGITFEPSDIPATPPAEGWIGEITGTGTWELPQPAVIIIDSDRIARFVAVSPDWLVRTEAPEIVAALQQLKVKAAA